MSLRCRLRGHEPAPAPVWNAGRHFTTCVRCGIDLVRGRGMLWHPVPPGMRVVWKPKDESGADMPADDQRADAGHGRSDRERDEAESMRWLTDAL